ncbi:MAG: chromosome segregation protein SMC [Sporichthyaceae bacterium]
MHLKSLTLKGFKSFASATTLRLEPGITCVVGPNGSGKSNVVDALAWVMGEQGAKSLRGGKMEDVIFAGTAGRPPLGRAEVSLTIDNADGALPIDYAEVTITRTMFRNGGSEYAINGDSCRLLDVQELLSDSGIGREMHVIVGQGQLDAVLSATPEERRGFIEEAAGVLKHRKRKEKALRKLDAMQANLTRVSDLVTELRRQLKPLGKQAEVARRAAVVQADLRDARLRLLADELVTLRATLDTEVADENALRERAELVETELASVRERQAQREAELAADGPAQAAAQETWYRLSQLRERLTGTAGLASERARLLANSGEDFRPGRDPEDLLRQAEEVRAQEAELLAQVEAHRQKLAEAVAEREAAEAALTAEEKRVAVAQRAAADRREGLARLQGKVNEARARAQAAQAEIGRIVNALTEASTRADTSELEFKTLEIEAAAIEEGEAGLDEAYEEAAEALDQIEERLVGLKEAERSTEGERTALRARKETLELALTRRDGAGSLLDAPGVLGTASKMLTVARGHETAVAAALAGAADAVVVESVPAAVAALRHLKERDAGQAHLFVDSAPAGRRGSGDPGTGTPLLSLVTAPAGLRASVESLLADWVLVPDLDAAAALIAARPDLHAVTPEGDVVSAHRATGGSASPPSLLELQAAVDEATAALAAADETADRLRVDIAGAAEARAAAQVVADEALAALHESDAGHAALAEQLGRLAGAARAARGEAERLAASVAKAEEARDAGQAGLAELEERLAAAEQSPAEVDDAPDDRVALAAAATLARSGEMEARLALRTGEERVKSYSGRADGLVRAAQAERAAREQAAARRVERERTGRAAAAVAVAASATLELLDVSLRAAGAARAAADESRRRGEAELAELRTAERAHSTELERLTDSVHREEVARAEHRLRIEALEQRAVEELGVAPDVLVAEYGPDQLVPVLAVAEPAGDEDAPVVNLAEPTSTESVPFVRAEQEKRLRAAEKALTLLGKVNPLALEEFAALEERNQFLTSQLEDLKNSRRDLLTVVAEVDARVQEVFTSAWEDTEREFVGVFSRLFPGGEGKLILTDPSDMLTTGIEVEARPPGKKVKRLSLLSGGERSLVAVALLVSIFRARPSPFYVLDEVEAALDDTNLGRLITIMEELRENSQLIVITHQKRTMEVADALYGVSMRGDGVTTVISQKLREEQPA